MQVFPVPSAVRSPAARQYLTSFVVNRSLAIDAGSIGFGLTPAQQRKIKHIVLSHSHLDHIASLPTFLDCVYDASGDCVTVHATAPTLDTLRRDVFNNRLWPDFVEISKNVPPYLKLQEMLPGRPLELDGMRVTPFAVNHVIDCMGFLVEGPDGAVAFSSDTGPTEDLWRAARAVPNLKAVFLETTFPNRLSHLAEIARHLTPAMVVEECKKLPEGVRILTIHIHTRHRAAVEEELAQLGMPNLEICRFGKTFHF